MPALFDDLPYSPAPESPESAVAWLEAHGKRFGHFIGGHEVLPIQGKYFSTINPATGEILASVAQGTTEDVDAAMEAAYTAFCDWSYASARVRGRVLYNLQRTMEKYARSIQVLEALDNGKSFRETRDIDIPLAIRHFRYHAGWAQVQERDYPNHKAQGVVAQITPWNFPLLMLAWKIAPAIAVGNTVILKPAEYTPLSALFFAELLEEAKVPPGVVNIVTGDGATGALLVEHAIPWKIAFTGSTEVGRKIRLLTAGTDKELSLELGGKSAFIVCADADLDAVAEGVVKGIWFNQGQVCCAGSRLFVEESIFDEVIERLKRRMRTLRGAMAPTYQLDKAIDMGAINSREQLMKIQNLCKIGEDEHAEIWQPESWMCPQKGYFFPPTLFTKVQPASTIAQEEIFGPVLVCMTFRTPEEAVALANNTRYGLAASVWTENVSKALEVSKRVVAGTVWVNSTNLFDAASGFGGYRESGFGREGGREGILEYVKENFPQRDSSFFVDMPYVSHGRPQALLPGRADEPYVSLDITHRFLIGGKLARPDGQNSFHVYTPSGELLGVCADANRKDIRNAVRSARKALPAWEQASADLRGKILAFAAENLEKHAQQFIQLLIRCGSNQDSAAEEVEASIDRLLYYAGRVDKYEGTVQPVPYPIAVVALKEPRGVLALRAPDELPLLSFISLLAPAYAMGNAVVAVTGSNPIPALEFMQILQMSEIPAGSLNILTADNPDAAAKTLAEHKDVDCLWYYGSADGCTMVKQASVTNMKKVVTNNGKRVDWFGSEGEAEYFLRAATNVKNIWIPSGY